MDLLMSKQFNCAVLVTIKNWINAEEMWFQMSFVFSFYESCLQRATLALTPCSSEAGNSILSVF